MSIKCGSCKGHHETVAEVKICCAMGSQDVARSLLSQMGETKTCTFGEPHQYGTKVCPVCHPEPERVTPLARAIRPVSPAPIYASVGRARNLDEQRSRQATAVAVREPETAGSELQRTSTMTGFPAVEDGHYAIEREGEVKFYKVNNGKPGTRWAKYIFLDIQASEVYYPIKNREIKQEILEAIAADPEEATRRYGRELGKCGVCGLTLTNEESRSYGVGPICRGKKGW